MINIRAGDVDFSVNGSGILAAISTHAGDHFLDGARAVPFIRIGADAGLLDPVRAVPDAGGMNVEFATGTVVRLAIETKPTHAVVACTGLSGPCDALVFGPWPVTVRGTVGTVIGAVWDDRVAIGAQALTPHTIAGFPQEYLAQCPVAEAARDAAPRTSVGSLDYRHCAAFPLDESRAVLQFYCLDRNRQRLADVMGHPAMPVPAFDGPDAGIVGSKLALFGCDGGGRPETADETGDMPARVLDRIGAIEVAEGLPHPLIDGVWGKTSRQAMRSYLITEFSVETIDRVLDHAERAGFREIYHPEPFATWGHFVLRPDHFPEGDRSLIDCAERARRRGIGIGLHTLTNFTTTNDAYVTPVPHDGLVTRGRAALCAGVDAESSTLLVSKADFLSEVSFLSTVRVDDELVRYSEAHGTADGEIELRGCTRGAFATVAAAHPSGATVSKLIDHAYKVFFPDLRLQDRYVDRLVDLFNAAGLVQISFDGLEGCRYTGEGEYAVNRFCSRFFDGVRNPVINDASRLGHYLWHMHTRMNWGEPWGAAMREGMMDARIANQEFFRNNLFPRMLGWFLYRTADRRFAATTREDLEWALSKAAGFDAGFALVARPGALEQMGQADVAMELVGRWEAHRLAGHFSAELRENLRHRETEWRLESGPDGTADLLFPLALPAPSRCDLLELQPGQPGGADWSWDNPYGSQPLRLRLYVQGQGWIRDPTFRVGDAVLRIDATIHAGEYLLLDGTAVVTDRNFGHIRDLTIGTVPIVPQGRFSLSFSCGFGGDEPPEISVWPAYRGASVRLPAIGDSVPGAARSAPHEQQGRHE